MLHSRQPGPVVVVVVLLLVILMPALSLVVVLVVLVLVESSSTPASVAWRRLVPLLQRFRHVYLSRTTESHIQCDTSS